MTEGTTINVLTKRGADALFLNKLAFIKEIDMYGIIICVDGVDYEIQVDWKYDEKG